MPAPTFIQNLLWVTVPLTLFTNAFLLYRRGYIRHFPGFFCYLLFVAIKSCALFPLMKIWGFNSYPYFYTSWAANMISIGLSFLVLYEVAKNVLTSGTLRLSRANVILVASVLLLAAALVSLTFQANDDQALMKIYLISNNLVRFEQTGMLVLMALLTLFFGFYWGDLAFGIALGFGFYATMAIVSTYIRGHLGPQGTHFSNLIDVWSYQIASLIWLFYLLKKPKSPLLALPSDKVSEYTEPIERLTR